jgi:hypothetical protein
MKFNPDKQIVLKPLRLARVTFNFWHGANSLQVVFTPCKPPPGRDKNVRWKVKVREGGLLLQDDTYSAFRPSRSEAERWITKALNLKHV